MLLVKSIINSDKFLVLRKKRKKEEGEKKMELNEEIYLIFVLTEETIFSFFVLRHIN